jgi:hypothetical protein
MAKTITWKTKRKREKGKSKERSKDWQLTRTKKRKELVPLLIRSYLIHSPSSCLHANLVIRLMLLACKSRDKKLSHPQPLMLLACKSRDLVIVECLK